jgi:hypothetical protein
MQELIPRCWLLAPDQRPTFDEIIRDFKDVQYRIVPRADAVKLGLYVEKIEGWEAKAGAQSQSK